MLEPILGGYLFDSSRNQNKHGETSQPSWRSESREILIMLRAEESQKAEKEKKAEKKEEATVVCLVHDSTSISSRFMGN